MKLISTNSGELPVSNVLPPSLRNYRIPHATCYVSTAPSGHCILQEKYAGEFSAWYTDILSTREDRLVAINNKPMAIFQLALNNTHHHHIQGIGDMIYHEWSFNMCYVSSLYAMVHTMPSHYAAMNIYVPVKYLQSLEDKYPILAAFIYKVLHGRPARLSRFNHIATPLMMRLAREIRESSSETQMNEKIRQLLELGLGKATLQPLKKPARMKDEEVLMIYAAKQYIFDHLQQRVTLEELSKHMNVTTYQLKKGFTRIYGLTLKELLFEERMKKAAELLADKRNLRISEVASSIGYLNENSFIRAFRNFYGVYPGTWRRNR